MILTTHSPHIAAVAPLRSLLLLRKCGSVTVASTTLNADLNQFETADISRYLDVSRAELLFARYVLLVEGTAEAFLLPAIAEAAGFDLDEHGVVIVNVVGTDFGPYRALLGSKGLNLPSAVLTDGDPLGAAAGSPEQGLKRAATLLTDSGATEKVEQGIRELIALRKAGDGKAAADLRLELQDVCALENVFVGDHTLELDLLPLFGDEMVAAFAELAGEQKGANMARDVTAVLAALDLEKALSETTAEVARKAHAEPPTRTSDGHRRTRVLARIEKVGKGRFAQRWAAHIGEVDLWCWLTYLLGISGFDVADDVDDGTAPVTEKVLKEAGSARACLRLLDWASQQARGIPLLPPSGEPDDG
jgi:putative ATP-dependent endonuclease of the OLD family